jgi:hypothetical protein
MPLTAAQSLPATVGAGDPLHYDAPLPFEVEYFPMGQPLRIATNSRLVHAVSESVWSRFRRLSDDSPVLFHVEVVPPDSEEPPVAPILRAREHLVSMISNSRNFVHADLRAGFAFGHFTEDFLEDTAFWRYHFLEPLAYLLIGAMRFTYLHAASVSRYGRAVILCGDSGAGKTCLAFACASRGWTFHSGDATAILRNNVHRILGRPFEIRFRSSARDLFGELDGYPAALRPNEKQDIEIDTSDLGITTAVEGTPAHIVFLHRTDGTAQTSIAALPRHEARFRLEQSICFGDQTIRDEQRVALNSFLSLPAWQLTYSDWDEAEELLRSLVAVR